jgi:hypothetical protein
MSKWIGLMPSLVAIREHHRDEHDGGRQAFEHHAERHGHERDAGQEQRVALPERREHGAEQRRHAGDAHCKVCRPRSRHF